MHACTQLEERLADRHTARTTKKVDEDEFNKLANQYVDIADKKEEAWVDTTEFNLAIGAAILVNALMIGVETEMCAFFVRPIAASQENYRTPAAIGSPSLSLLVCVCVCHQFTVLFE